MVETPSLASQLVETPKQQEVTARVRASVNTILHPSFIDHPDKKPDGVVWPKIKPGEQTSADQIYKKFAIDVDGRSVSLYNYLDDTKGVFDSLIDCLTPEQKLKLPTRTIDDVKLLEFGNPEVRLGIIQGVMEQIDVQGIDKFGAIIAKLGDIQSVDALQVLQALGVAYANDIIYQATEPQSITTTEVITTKKHRREIHKVDHGKLMPSEFARTLRTGEDKKTLELSKESNELYRPMPEHSPTREFQRPVEVDLRMAVALQDILLPPAERLMRIQLEQEIAVKKAARAARETSTEEGDELNKILKKLISDEDAVKEIDELTTRLEKMRQTERAAILVGLKVGYEDGKQAVEPPIDPVVQKLADEIQKGIPAVLNGKTLETNRNQTMAMLELVSGTPMSDAQKLVLEKYLSSSSIQTRTSAESVLKELGLEDSSQKDILIKVIADGRRVTVAFGSLAKKQDGYSQVEDVYSRGTIFDMGLKGVEFLYRQGDITSELKVESTTSKPEVKTELVTPTSHLIQAEIPAYILNESSIISEPPVVKADTEKSWPIDNSAESDLGVGMPGFNVPVEAKPKEEKPWPIDRSDEADTGVGSIYGEPVERMPPQFEQLLNQDLQVFEDSELDKDTTPPEVPTTIDRGKEKKKRPLKEDQKETAAYYIWERRSSGNEHLDQERARTELSVEIQDQVDALKSQIVIAEQAALFEPTDDQIRLSARINYEVRTKDGAPVTSSPEDQNADWEAAKKHLIELRKQAVEETQEIYQAQLAESQIAPSQAKVDEHAYAHFDGRVTGTDKTDWTEAEKLLKLKVGVRSLQDLHHLGFSQQEIAAFGKIRNKTEIIKKINERNTALGYPLWTDDTITRKFVAYGVKEARNLQEAEERIRSERVTSLIDAIVLRKMGEEGFARLKQGGIEPAALISLDGNDQAIDEFIQKQGWQNDEQTITFVKSIIEAAKT